MRNKKHTVEGYKNMYLKKKCVTSMNYKSPFSARLRIKLQLARGSEEATIALLSKKNAPSWFRTYLVLTHSVIRSSVPLMCAAYDNCIDSPEDTDLVASLRKYYKKHIQEEMHHDEWILDDLESIGESRRDSLSQKPSQKVAEAGRKPILLDLSLASCLLTRSYIIFGRKSSKKGNNLSTTATHWLS